jgi:8-amino-7-oxononanoate synthase
MTPEHWIDEKLAALDEQHQLRTLEVNDGQARFNFATNDYLDFAHRIELRDAATAALNTYGAGSGASRLVSGTLPIHEEVEAAIARAKGYPAALLFGSGYLTSIGCIPPLVGRGDVIFADRLVHACLLDGIQLSGAKLVRFHHNDVDHLAAALKKNGHAGRKLIITESVFSMDGDIAPLQEIAGLASEHGAMLVVDEAHATGVFGPRGSGLVAFHNLQPRVQVAMSTFSKALGGYGGAVACSPQLRTWLINKGRSFIYTTAPPPAVCGTILAALQLLEREPSLGETLQARALFFRELLRQRGFDTGDSRSQIVPVIIGDNETTLAIAAKLKRAGILVGAIRPPTVPAGTARLRFSITLAHKQDDLRYAADELQRAAEACEWKK